MLKLENVTKTFGKIVALKDINFNIGDSEFVFITGASGAGKTTLLRLMLRELLPDSGKIELDKEDITKLPSKQIPRLRQKIGVVFQDFKVLGERTIKENVEVALAVIGLPKNDWEARVEHVLKLVGLTDRADLFPAQLSGGELQRVSLARALVVNPKIILADEPTGNLDWETADKLMDLFEKINSEGKSIIMATHNKLIIDKMNKRVIELKEGGVFSDSESKVKTKSEKGKK
ncbi:MAG: Cell division ATP-binding protein FtsE [Candidatus Woesebacteria bacterium GW2011_GWB1_39_12]|uniref:Cell division ATP-binding protein FtsE n=2 Tax=Candidatus Woeseibacteriota TaxID=1752722 RepID=A0A0G0Q6Y2_9BACT|nr:MAG: Cell division ATP-binding protein FtsE [Candidatus Woesebacteria bacterium GW2011_GWA1_39_12]KKR00921.1 MAG: Cell division ATP-binding protein FtsE [Candidatus Woesebacteria bacterium GW2011_GWB1_39_12]